MLKSNTFLILKWDNFQQTTDFIYSFTTQYQRCSLECFRIDLVILYTCGDLFIQAVGKQALQTRSLLLMFSAFVPFLYFLKPCRAKCEQTKDSDCHRSDNRKYKQGCFCCLSLLLMYRFKDLASIARRFIFHFAFFLSPENNP